MTPKRENEIELLTRATALAAEKHFGQFDLAGVAYFKHPVAVARRVESLGLTAQTVAILHDILEDTDVTYGELALDFGPLIANTVRVLTRRFGEETYLDYIRRVAPYDLPRKIKMADLEENLSRGASLPERLKKRYVKALSILKEADNA